MKKEIHPDNYRLVVFQDVSCDYSFLTRSTVKTSDTIKWEDGKEYPLYKLDISDRSHPYFTGKQNLVDSAGRIEKFNRKYKIPSDEAVKTVEETPISDGTHADETVKTVEETPVSEGTHADDIVKTVEEAPDKEKKD